MSLETRAALAGPVLPRRTSSLRRPCLPLACGLALAALTGCHHDTRPAAALRLGHFPNLTHSQALWGRATGEVARTAGVPVEWTLFNAGPSAVEALFAGAIDATYIGPNPATNGFLKSHGESFVIVAGAASGGAALVVRPSAGIASPADFRGKTVATPQLGNTQDVAARIWFAGQGLIPRDRGGELNLLALANPDQLLMMQKGEIDAAWTVEPWVSRLEQEAGARAFLEERELWPDGRYITALIVVRRAYLAANPGIVDRLLEAHIKATLALRADPRGLAPLLSEEIGRETKKALPLPIVHSALNRIELTWDPLLPTLEKAAADAHAVGFLAEKPNLAGIFDPAPLERALRASKQPPLPASERAR